MEFKKKTNNATIRTACGETITFEFYKVKDLFYAEEWHSERLRFFDDKFELIENNWYCNNYVEHYKNKFMCNYTLLATIEEE